MLEFFKRKTQIIHILGQHQPFWLSSLIIICSRQSSLENPSVFGHCKFNEKSSSLQGTNLNRPPKVNLFTLKWQIFSKLQIILCSPNVAHRTCLNAFWQWDYKCFSYTTLTKLRWSMKVNQSVDCQICNNWDVQVDFVMFAVCYLYHSNTF